MTGAHSVVRAHSRHLGETLPAPQIYLSSPAHPVFDVISRDWLAGAVEVASARIDQPLRRGLERTLDLALWLDMYRPVLKLS